MNSTKKIIVLILLIFITCLSASNLKLGIYGGVNEFLIETRVWDQNDLYENYLGYYFFDERGTSYQLGAQLFISDRLSAMLQYHSPRRGMSYFYSADHEMRPGVNPQTMTVVRSYVSGFSGEVRYYLTRNKMLLPYFGLGGELAILNAGDFVPTDDRYIGDFRLVPEHFFKDMGTKVLGGLILPAGVLVNVIGQIYLDLSINYTFLHLGEWDVTGDIPVEQDLSGMYLKIGIGYHISSY
jgi:opacity protein-like surface antigen